MNERYDWCGAWLFTDENLTSNVLLLETVLNTSHINSDTFGGKFSLDNAKSNPPLVYLYIGLHKTNLAVRQIGPSLVVYVPRLARIRWTMLGREKHPPFRNSSETRHINSDTFGGNFSLDNVKSNPPLVYLYIVLHKTNLAVQ